MIDAHLTYEEFILCLGYKSHVIKDFFLNYDTFTNDFTILLGGKNKVEFINKKLSIYEFDLVCPFNIIAGKCPPITENNNRTGMAIAQIEIAKRTIDQSTDTALNRLKWIRRNKDKQNLTNLNIDINFTNQMLTSLTKAVKTSAAKKNIEDKDQDVFYWSEGSIAVGRMGDTSLASTRKIGTEAITVGADKFTNNNGIRGLAFRVGRNDVDVGTAGSNLDTDTYNLTYYTTSPIEGDTKFVDTIVGVGKLSSDLITVLDGKNLTADRYGEQIYVTIRIKDEIKRNKNFSMDGIDEDLFFLSFAAFTSVIFASCLIEQETLTTPM